MKKCLLLSMFVLLIVAVMPAWSASGDDVVGLWYTDGGKSKVEIVRNQDEFNGKIVWLEEEVYPEDDPDAGKVKVDRNNPEEKLRSKPLLGLELVWGFKYDEKGRKWERGKIYDPESGKTYNCNMWLDEEGNLNVKGSLDKWGLVGRSTVWTPAEE